MYTAICNSFNNKNTIHQIGEYSKIVGANAVNEDVKEALDLVPQLYYSEKNILQKKEELLELMSKINALIAKSNHHTIISV